MSAPICIDKTYPFARALARSTVAASSTLRVEVLYVDTKGRAVSEGSLSHVVKSRAWAPTALMGITAKLDGAAPISFRFTAPQGSGWLLDDFYVDPRGRG